MSKLWFSRTELSNTCKIHTNYTVSQDNKNEDIEKTAKWRTTNYFRETTQCTENPMHLICYFVCNKGCFFVNFCNSNYSSDLNNACHPASLAGISFFLCLVSCTLIFVQPLLQSFHDILWRRWRPSCRLTFACCRWLSFSWWGDGLFCGNWSLTFKSKQKLWCFMSWILMQKDVCLLERKNYSR